MKENSLSYQISIPDLARREFVISLTIHEIKDHAPILLMMPSWTPGSYLIRDHAGSITSISATQGSHSIKISKIAKNQFSLVSAGESPICVTYRISAVDDSVRRLWISHDFAFLTGAAAFLCPKGMEHQASKLSFLLPFPAWENVRNFV